MYSVFFTFIKNSLLFFLLFSFLMSCNSPSGDNNKESKNDSIISDNSTTQVENTELNRLNKLIEEDGTNSENFHNRAEYFIKIRSFEFALEDANEAIKLDSSNPNFFITLSGIHLERGKLKPAISALEKALMLDFENIEAILKMAEVNIVFDRNDEAIKYINKVIAIDDMEPKGYFLRGMVWLNKGDTVTGIKNFLESINVDKDYYEAHMQLGRLYASKGNELAINYFINASQIEPNAPDPLYHLGTYYQNKHQADKAIETYESLLDKVPNYYFALYNIAYIHMVEKGDYETAISYFDQALKFNPNYANAWYNKGFAYELMGNNDLAISNYEKATQIRPDFQLAIERLAEIRK